MFGRRKTKTGRSDPTALNSDDSFDNAPGWAAIDRSMSSLYGDQQPQHWGNVAAGLIGPARLDGISAYDAGNHWHFVTLGLTEIWERESAESISGLGYEFTFRTRKRRRQPPPAWALHLLERLGEASLEGTAFLPGHTLDPGGPITGQGTSRLVGLVFIEDPELQPIETPNGRMSFTQAVGVTAQELAAIRAETMSVSELSGNDGLFITDAFR